MVKRNAFYSFHYAQDAWRAAQVRNMGVVDGNVPAKDNDWEQIKRGGENAIKRWIKDQLSGRSVTIVLIGQGTAGRKWINYEIVESWNSGKGVLGIYIHNLLDENKNKSRKGSNPFDKITFNKNSKLSSVVDSFDPPYTQSQDVHKWIKDNLSSKIEDAIKIRNKYSK